MYPGRGYEEGCRDGKEPLGEQSSVGMILGIRPRVLAVVFVAHREFDRLWLLAFSDQIEYTYLPFMKPHNGKASVLNVSFSTQLESRSDPEIPVNFDI
jgi:hypothetical protein